MELDLQIKNSP